MPRVSQIKKMEQMRLQQQYNTLEKKKLIVQNMQSKITNKPKLSSKDRELLKTEKYFQELGCIPCITCLDPYGASYDRRQCNFCFSIVNGSNPLC